MARKRRRSSALGRMLDAIPGWPAAALGGAVGVTAGLVAGGATPLVGAAVFAGVLVASAWLAWSGEVVAVIVPERRRSMDRGDVGAAEQSEEHAGAAEYEAEVAGVKALTDDDGGALTIDPLAMVELPGGTFVMGSPDGDDMTLDAEKPPHSVRVSGFACMAYPVTRGLWHEVMGAEHEWWPKGPADDRPVNNVNWFDAVRFCNAVSQRHGLTPCYRIEGDGSESAVTWVSSQGYRLPTEAEWEYACRAGTRTRWSFGDDPEHLDEHAWYDGNAEGEPHPVGRKAPNPWGLYDMHGNLWEWCWDWYGEYRAADPEQPQTDPQGPEAGSGRVLRGGSFFYWARITRCANRFRIWPKNRGRDDGFRCVRGSGRQP
ncbi:formylglycine-generating enzyme family protein [Haliangium sp.]|uniref:formylglycine-generating enzyme family protein n=1 Tax=Haliangium sp. TaxID=2663208 RepID=UPI003D0EFE3F